MLNSFSLMCMGKTVVLKLLLKGMRAERHKEQKYIVQPNSRAYGVLDSGCGTVEMVVISSFISLNLLVYVVLFLSRLHHIVQDSGS